MDIKETAITIGGWIESCDNYLQIALCRQAIHHFIIVRFTFLVSAGQMAEVVEYLDVCIQVQEKNWQAPHSLQLFSM